MYDDENADDQELYRLREARLSQLKKEASLDTQLYGQLTPVSLEKEAVHISSQCAKLVMHFRMPTFRRCAIMSEHLMKLAKLYPKTRFIEVNADEVPFLVAKFKVQVLPCLVVIIMGQVVDKYVAVMAGSAPYCCRIVGFDDLGGSDEFPTSLLQLRLQVSGALPAPIKSKQPDFDSDTD